VTTHRTFIVVDDTSGHGLPVGELVRAVDFLKKRSVIDAKTLTENYPKFKRFFAQDLAEFQPHDGAIVKLDGKLYMLRDQYADSHDRLLLVDENNDAVLLTNYFQISYFDDMNYFILKPLGDD